MLEVKNLVKEYRPKKGNPVRAVDGINLKFPEKGMIFILGKSGSGKSTLLNLLGGLDKYDSGEIIIKGKSSKDFSQSEFDSYRNTYLGFIFQEYNILNDFNVAQNIAIALQLQGQKATSERINEILKEVDLEGYGGRKPSELSGGQKQRVAIARALVKNPEIIMADEPTGALDSKTGLQVFDTLKKLSEDKLVITITHDRDFAEMYGDRVIELKDGKVISDIEKYTASATAFSEGISVTDDKVVSIKKGYVLTEKDVQLINDYLQKGDVLLSADEKVSGDLKRFARINDDGGKESFRDTDESKIANSEDKKFRLIKSRLPLKNKIVIGASGLKNKPIRLIVTILLSVVAFTMFGLTDTLAAYNKIRATEKSIEESGISAAAFRREAVVGEGEDAYKMTTRFSDDDLTAFIEKSGMDFRPVLPSPIGGIGNYFVTQPQNSYYSSDFGGVINIDGAYINKTGFSYVGKLPSGENEVAISKHFYQGFAAYGFRNGEIELKADDIKTAETFLAKKPTFSFGDSEYLVTAVIDTGFNDEKYSSLNEKGLESGGITDFFLLQEMEADIRYGFHGLLFTGDALWQKILAYTQANNTGSFSFGNEYVWSSYSTVAIASQASEQYDAFYFGNETLGSGEVLIDLRSALIMMDQYSWMVRGASDAKSSDFQTAVDTYFNYVQYGTEPGAITNDAELRAYVRNEIVPYLKQNESIFSSPKQGYYSSNGGGGMSWNVSVVGVVIDKHTTESAFSSKIVLDDDKGTLLVEESKRVYPWVISVKPTKAQWKSLVKLHYDGEDDPVSYSMENSTTFTLGMLNDLVETLSHIFLYIGIGFALFAALMLTNFISTSIVYKRREIGILRAVGARGSDVYGIFAIESVIIALINFVLSTIATGVIAAVIGRSFRNEYHLSVSILNFGIRQVGLILLVAIGVALIASFLPTFRISRQKPVDAIKK